MMLTKAYPLLLLAALAAWSLSLPAALARLRERVGKARTGTWPLLLLVVLGAFALRASRPGAHRVFDDEFEHLDAARRVASQGVYGVTVAGGLPGLNVYAAPTWPAGHHAALAAWMIAAGDSTRAAREWSVLLGALTVLLVFWGALEAFDDERAALAAACAWAALPLAVRYSVASDLTASSLFWIAAALAALHARENAPSRGLDAFAAITLFYALQVRPENGVLIVYAFAVLSRRALALPAVLGALVPLSLALSNRSAGVPGYAAADLHPLRFLSAHAGSDFAFLLGLPAGIAVMLGAAGAAFRRPARALSLAALSAAFFCVYASFYRGEFGRGSEDRYALSVLLPLTVAAAGALEGAALPAALLFAGLGFVSPAPAEPVEHERARRLLAAASAALPRNSVVIGFNPSKLREVSGRPAASAYFFLEDPAGFVKIAAGAGAAPEFAVWKDWGWRSRPEDARRLEELLAKRYDARSLGRDGEDELVLFTPR